MNTQVRIFAPGVAAPGAWRDATRRSAPLPTVIYLKQLPDIAFVSTLRIARSLLQAAALGVGIPTGLLLVLITVAKDGVTTLIETHTPGKRS